MGKKAAPGLRLTSRVGRSDDAAGEDGFTLLEAVCVLAIVAMLAAVVLPAIPRGTSRAGLEAYALETASLLQADRNAAIRRHQQIATAVDAAGRSVRSGATGRTVRVPDDVRFNAILPARCNQRPAYSTISFFASGMSCGGTIDLVRLGAGYRIRVNWVTGGVEIVPHKSL
jgi:general secretion pathway protein H